MANPITNKFIDKYTEYLAYEVIIYCDLSNKKLLVVVDYLLSTGESYGPTATYLQDCTVFFKQLNNALIRIKKAAATFC